MPFCNDNPLTDVLGQAEHLGAYVVAMLSMLCLGQLSPDNHINSMERSPGKTGPTLDFCRWNSSALVVCAKRRRCSCSAGRTTVLEASSAPSGASAAGVPFLGSMAGRAWARSSGLTFSLQRADACCFYTATGNFFASPLRYLRVKKCGCKTAQICKVMQKHAGMTSQEQQH